VPHRTGGGGTDIKRLPSTSHTLNEQRAASRRASDRRNRDLNGN
jgi:hypothetical protein